MKKINELEDAANIGSNPFMMAGRMTDATADAMQTAAGNSAGAMTGFMGMGMVGMGGQGGFGAAQNLYNMGAQQKWQSNLRIHLLIITARSAGSVPAVRS